MSEADRNMHIVTRLTNLGADTLRGPYLRIKESIFCLQWWTKSSHNTFTRSAHDSDSFDYSYKAELQPRKRTCNSSLIGAVNSMIVLIPQGLGTRPQKLRRVS